MPWGSAPWFGDEILCPVAGGLACKPGGASGRRGSIRNAYNCDVRQYISSLEFGQFGIILSRWSCVQPLCNRCPPQKVDSTASRPSAMVATRSRHHTSARSAAGPTITGATKQRADVAKSCILLVHHSAAPASEIALRSVGLGRGGCGLSCREAIRGLPSGAGGIVGPVLLRTGRGECVNP